MSEDRWYPGKFAVQLTKRAHETSNSIQDAQKLKSALEGANIAINPAKTAKLENEEIQQKLLSLSKSPIVGSAKIRIEQIKYLRMTDAKVTVKLEKAKTMPKDCVDLSDKKEGNRIDLPFTDIASDIVITIKGKSIADSEHPSAPIQGVIILPLVTYLGPTGKCKPAKLQWHLVYPSYTYTRVKEAAVVTKYTSGFSELNGYALTKPKLPLGFLELSVELNLHVSWVQCYLSPTYCRPKWLEVLNDAPIDNFQEYYSGLSEAQSDAVALAIYNRDVTRLRKFISFPALFAPLLSFPEFFVLVAAAAFCCYSVRLWQLPVFLTALVLFNGILTNSARSYSDVIIWNDPLTPMHHSGNVTSSSAGANNNSSAASAVATPNRIFSMSYGPKKVFYSSVSFNGFWLSCLETVANLFCFGDPRISLLFYASLFALSVVVSVFLLVGLTRTLLFIVLLLATTLLSCLEPVTEFLDYMLSREKQQIEENIYSLHLKRLTYFCQALFSLLSRVPDEQELIHRHISQSCLTREDSPDMMDMAALHTAEQKKPASAGVNSGNSTKSNNSSNNNKTAH